MDRARVSALAFFQVYVLKLLSRLMDASYWEFKDDVPKYIRQLELISESEYNWGTYDVLVQPQSAPFGGMENTCMYAYASSDLF